eukprot:scaffold124785_cov51-Phaeocystis_antarctica.AAC.2
MLDVKEFIAANGIPDGGIAVDNIAAQDAWSRKITIENYGYDPDPPESAEMLSAGKLLLG